MRNVTSPRRLLALVGAALGLLPSVGRGEPPRMSSLAWVRLDGAEGCIASGELARAVEDRLGRRVFVSPADADVTLEGSVAPREGGGFSVKVVVTGRDGEDLGTRQLSTPDNNCRALDDRIALILSLLIEPESGEQPADPPPPAPAPTAPQIIERERVVQVPTAPREPWRVQLAVAGALSAGAQPALAATLTPSLLLVPPRLFGVLLQGGLSAPTSVAVERGARIDASFVHGALSVCPWTPHQKRWRGALCGGVLLGSLRGEGVGFDRPKSASALTLGPAVQARAGLQLWRNLELHAGLSGLLAARRAELRYRDAAGPVAAFRTSVTTASLEIGIAVRLP